MAETFEIFKLEGVQQHFLKAMILGGQRVLARGDFSENSVHTLMDMSGISRKVVAVDGDFLFEGPHSAKTSREFLADQSQIRHLRAVTEGAGEYDH